ncbi:MAG: hypothetical protein HOP09_13490 [Hyphomicrobium sp.]|nr:hypothetical protein [Hyphomicrobium sp.]
MQALYAVFAGLLFIVAAAVLPADVNLRRFLASDLVATLDADINLQDSPRDIGDKLQALYQDTSRGKLIASLATDHGLRCDGGKTVRCSKNMGGFVCPQKLFIDLDFDQAERLKSASAFTENPCN